MTAREFCYWLQGYFEILDSSSNRAPDTLTPGQVECVQKHLAMVFKHEIDPTYPDGAALDHLHGGPKLPSGVTARC